MYNLVLELMVMFGLDQTPQTFAELFPWMITVFIAICLVLYVFNCLFIITKAVTSAGKKG